MGVGEALIQCAPQNLLIDVAARPLNDKIF